MLDILDMRHPLSANGGPMKRLIVGLVLSLFTTGLFAEDGSGLKYSGEFMWTKKEGQNYPITATLTPDGAGKWKAVYNFTWSKKPMVYSGTLTGDLKNGPVSGVADNGEADKKKRTWIFTGKSENGVITISHTETTGGKNVATGTATFKNLDTPR